MGEAEEVVGRVWGREIIGAGAFFATCAWETPLRLFCALEKHRNSKTTLEPMLLTRWQEQFGHLDETLQVLIGQNVKTGIYGQNYILILRNAVLKMLTTD